MSPVKIGQSQVERVAASSIDRHVSVRRAARSGVGKYQDSAALGRWRG
jgi:hypothetical protein